MIYTIKGKEFCTFNWFKKGFNRLGEKMGESFLREQPQQQGGLGLMALCEIQFLGQTCSMNWEAECDV